MNGFPCNLILAVATASATIFLGFLPTKNVRSEFFARETLKAAIAWMLIAMVSPPGLMHYYILFGLLCGGAWWKFNRDNALSGKMWLSIASGLGISIGVMLILAVTPQAYPPSMSQSAQAFLLTSIYLGGSVVGLAYVCYALNKGLSTQSGITSLLVQRYVGLLLLVALARAALLFALIFLNPYMNGDFDYHQYQLPAGQESFHLFGHEFIWDTSGGHAQDRHFSLRILVMLGLDVVVISIAAFCSRQAGRSLSRVGLTQLLLVICFLGLVAEILARLLVL